MATTKQAPLVSTPLQFLAAGLILVAVTAGLGGQLMKLSGLPHWDAVLMLSSGALVGLAVTGLVAGIQIGRRRSAAAVDLDDRAIPSALLPYLFLAGSAAILAGVAGEVLSVLGVPGATPLLYVAFTAGLLFLVLGVATAGIAAYRALA
jgi:hypothetical protein